jgi:hypothetical protein
MQFLSKAAVLLLLIAVMVAPLAAQENYASGTQERSAACHEDSGNVPAPRPVSHSCCQAGHYSAIVQQTSTVRPPLRVSVQFVFMRDSVSLGLGTPSSLAVMCGDPPIASPLRV